MTNVSMHVNHEKNVEIEVSEEQSIKDYQGNECKYHTVSFNRLDTLYLTPEQAEELYNKLDAALHDETFQDLENENMKLRRLLRMINEDGLRVAEMSKEYQEFLRVS